MSRLAAIGILTCVLGWAGPAVADECWSFDNFATDFIRLDIKPDFDPKRVVAGFWQIDVSGHTGRVLLVGTSQRSTEVDGSKGIALQGSIQDGTLANYIAFDAQNTQSPGPQGAFFCWLHLKFPSSFDTGNAWGDCPGYNPAFAFTNEPITQVSCDTIPPPTP
jgi:hypothetical protein